MEKQKKNYEAPDAKILEYDFSENVIASASPINYCNSREVWGTSYQDGRCWPVYTDK